MTDDIARPDTANSSSPGAAPGRRFALRELNRPHLDVRLVDGAWWPRSADLGDGVPDLVAAAASAGFVVRRVSFSLDDAWSAAPRKVPVDGGRVRLGGFHKQARNMLTLTGETGWDQLQILVVPPDTPDPVAERALSLASDMDEAGAGSDILERARSAGSGT